MADEENRHEAEAVPLAVADLGADVRCVLYVRLATGIANLGGWEVSADHLSFNDRGFLGHLSRLLDWTSYVCRLWFSDRLSFGQ